MSALGEQIGVDVVKFIDAFSRPFVILQAGRAAAIPAFSEVPVQPQAEPAEAKLAHLVLISSPAELPRTGQATDAERPLAA